MDDDQTLKFNLAQKQFAYTQYMTDDNCGDRILTPTLFELHKHQTPHLLLQLAVVPRSPERSSNDRMDRDGVKVTLPQLQGD
jgi:hypothetical protein